MLTPNSVKSFLLSEKVPSFLDDFFLVQPKVYFCEKIYKNVVLL